MKKLLIAAVLLAGVSLTNAQDMKFGAKAGLNISSLTGDVSDIKSKIGFQVGAFGEFKVSDKFAIQPELLFTSLGAKSDSSPAETLSLGYIAIPVMAKYFVSEKFSLELGPQLGFLISAKSKFDGNSQDVKDGFNSTDFGMNLGAGYDVAENINLGLRYTFGLSNVLKDSGTVKAQNSNFALALGYKF